MDLMPDEWTATAVLVWTVGGLLVAAVVAFVLLVVGSIQHERYTEGDE